MLRRRRRGKHYKQGRKAPAITTSWGEVVTYDAAGEVVDRQPPEPEPKPKRRRRRR